MTLTEKRYLAALARPASRSKQTMRERERLCLALLRMEARRNRRRKKSVHPMAAE